MPATKRVDQATQQLTQRSGTAVEGGLGQSLIRRDQLKAVALSHALVQHIGATKQVMRRKLFPVIRI